MTDSDLFVRMGDISTDIHFIADIVNSKLEYLSPAFEDIWEISAETAITHPLSLLDTIDPEDRNYVGNCYAHLMHKGYCDKITFKIITGQSVKYIRVSAFLLNDGSGRIAGIAEDFSVIQRNILYMEKVNARKNSMLEILAHDLKGPIGTISMLASGIRNDPQLEGNSMVSGIAKNIQDLCKRNITLIRDVVNSEFLESEQVELRKERADLAWEINDVIQNYKRSEDVIVKTFMLTTSAEKIYVSIDSLKFIQVINNLISNAIKFTADNGVIKIDITEHENTVRITVSDNGIGIPEDLQPYLFDKFTRARRIGLRGEEPVGLGMSIIKNIVEMHGGRIWFDSRENEGTNFYIELPKV